MLPSTLHWCAHTLLPLTVILHYHTVQQHAGCVWHPLLLTRSLYLSLIRHDCLQNVQHGHACMRTRFYPHQTHFKSMGQDLSTAGRNKHEFSIRVAKE